MNPQFTGVFTTVKEHGGVYAVCTEGELFYSPMYEDGSVNFEEFEIIKKAFKEKIVFKKKFRVDKNTSALLDPRKW